MSNTDKFVTIKVWKDTKQILDIIRGTTRQTLSELIDELAREKLAKVKPDIQKTID